MQNSNPSRPAHVRPDLRLVSTKAARAMQTVLGFSPRELRRLVAAMID